MKQAQITSENTAAKDLGVIFSSGIGGLTTIQEQAINLVFGEDSRVLVGSTKAMTGHLLGVAGAIEAIAVVASLQKGRLPVNIGMTEQDKECKVNVVTQAKAHPEKLEYALSNSLGFGGHNAVLAFRKWS